MSFASDGKSADWHFNEFCKHEERDWPARQVIATG